MKKATLAALALAFTASLALGACHTTHPHGCPPGQAKKGNCLQHEMRHW